MAKNQFDAELNDVAYRCFRDVADGDYIAARMAFKSELWVQYFWSAQQALEKYLKCILLLNRIESHNVGHRIQNALDLINTNADFQISLDDDQKEIFRRIGMFGENRYLEGCYYTRHYDLYLLDRLVWYIRQFCCSLGYHLGAKEKSPELFVIMLNAIEDSRTDPAKLNKAIPGKLGKILRNRANPARSALIWNNLYFTDNPNRKIKISSGISAENAPLSLRPQLVHELEKYIFLTKEARTEYSKLALARSKAKSRNKQAKTSGGITAKIIEDIES